MVVHYCHLECTESSGHSNSNVGDAQANAVDLSRLPNQQMAADWVTDCLQTPTCSPLTPDLRLLLKLICLLFRRHDGHKLPWMGDLSTGWNREWAHGKTVTNERPT